MEDKRKILELLLPVLQATRHGENIQALTYMRSSFGTENAIIKIVHQSGTKHIYVNVTGDSGIGMIKYIIKKIS